MQTLLQGGRVADETQIYQADLLIEDEKIQRIEPVIPVDEVESDCRVIPLAGNIILPGMIDAHTHYQLQSRKTLTADDFRAGSIAAACGGVTTFIDYADHLPERSLVDGLQKRIAAAEGRAVIDYSLHQTITRFDSEVAEELGELLTLGVNSVKIFTTYQREGYMIPEQDWEKLFCRLKEVELLATVHAEDDALIIQLEEEYQQKQALSPEMHPRIRPAKAEGLAVTRIGDLAQRVGIPVYIAHLSSQAGLQALQGIQTAGGMIYAETTPHYLILDESYLQKPDAQRYLMTPPLRQVEDQQALWTGLAQEQIQVVATDHCAFNLEQKMQEHSCLSILPGLPGSETLLPLMHHFGVVTRRWSYPKLVRLLAANPAKIFGLYPEKGSLQPGTDADLVVIDPNKYVTLTQGMLHSQAGYTPYEGIRVQGYPVMTFLRGQLIMAQGHFIGKEGTGQFIKASRSGLFSKK